MDGRHHESPRFRAGGRRFPAPVHVEDATLARRDPVRDRRRPHRCPLDGGESMFGKTSLLALVAGTVTLSILGLGNAQTPTSPQGAATQAYRPGLGDLMTMTV